ncbi:hypothetical protein NPIL_352621 [Nephila pilipes]|uniref:Uncharacterized protein n=1 Tax=Nephila pilipes TaxID=299642 RepID=A0A8X6NY93_NEPPI|nr:hypothetical protein NPIL_352621 [Nephila pilipes]
MQSTVGSLSSEIQQNLLGQLSVTDRNTDTPVTDELSPMGVVKIYKELSKEILNPLSLCPRFNSVCNKLFI